MQSHCLIHQERVATNRCVSCSKPLCQDCVQTYPEGIFCGDLCHDNALAASERALVIAKNDKELADWKQRQAAYKIIGYVVVGLVLFFGWDHFPHVFTDNVEKLWGVFKAFFKKIFP